MHLRLCSFMLSSSFFWPTETYFLLEKIKPPRQSNIFIPVLLLSLCLGSNWLAQSFNRANISPNTTSRFYSGGGEHWTPRSHRGWMKRAGMKANKRCRLKSTRVLGYSSSTLYTTNSMCWIFVLAQLCCIFPEFTVGLCFCNLTSFHTGMTVGGQLH